MFPSLACLQFSLTALERTFLGYFRTSLALSFLAVIIAQLFRLQHTEAPDKTLGFYVLGIPLASICIVAAILVLGLGAHRFWRQHNAILRGKVHAGGWEINAIAIVILLVCQNVDGIVALRLSIGRLCSRFLCLFWLSIAGEPLKLKICKHLVECGWEAGS